MLQSGGDMWTPARPQVQPISYCHGHVLDIGNWQQTTPSKVSHRRAESNWVVKLFPTRASGLDSAFDGTLLISKPVVLICIVLSSGKANPHVHGNANSRNATLTLDLQGTRRGCKCYAMMRFHSTAHHLAPAGRYVSSPSPPRMTNFSWKTMLCSSKHCTGMRSVSHGTRAKPLVLAQQWPCPQPGFL